MSMRKLINQNKSNNRSALQPGLILLVKGYNIVTEKKKNQYRRFFCRWKQCENVMKNHYICLSSHCLVTLLTFVFRWDLKPFSFVHLGAKV